MIHTPDATKIPDALRTLDWKSMDHERLWGDGEQLIVAVPVCHSSDEPERGWRYEFDVVTIECDEDFFKVKCADEPWDWDLNDADYYVEIRR